MKILTEKELKMSEVIYEDANIEVIVMDTSGAGGACHEYVIQRKDTEIVQDKVLGEVFFQDGAILENGVNGITNEALLMIVAHRLQSFQDGPFPSDFTANALAGVIFAVANLETRTKDRRARGVEGKDLT